MGKPTEKKSISAMSYFQYCYLSSFMEEVKRQTMNQKTLHSKYINIRFHVAYLFRQTAKCFFDRSKPYHFCSVISSYQINEWFVIMIQWLLLLSSNWDTVYDQKTWLHSEHVRTSLVNRVTKHLQWLPQPLLSKTGWRQKTDHYVRTKHMNCSKKIKTLC